MVKIGFLLATAGLILSVSCDFSRPVVGILTLPSDEAAYSAEKYSYFPASYVK
jgi:hypothetical protein